MTSLLKNITLLTLTIYLFLLPEVFSSNLQNSLPVRIKNIKDIPENDVQCLFKDKHGFMWIGTLDGLHRYDGTNLRTFRPGQNKFSINSSMIIDIDEDSLGNIWIGTYGKGFGKLNPKTQRFTPFSEKLTKFKDLSLDVICLMVDNKNIIWIGTWNGLIRIQLDKSQTQIVKEDFLPLKILCPSEVSESVKVIHQDKNGNIWVGTNVRIILLENPYASINQIKTQTNITKSECICDFKNGILTGGKTINAFEYVNGQVKKTFVAEHETLAILYSQGFIWAGSRKGIACFKSTENNSWKKIQTFSNDFSQNSLNSNIITALCLDLNDQIWVGTRGGGVDVINLRPKHFEHYSHTPNKNSLGNNLVRCIFEDSEENLWIGTEENGMSLLRKSETANYSNGFIHIEVNDDPSQNRVYAVEETFTPESKAHNRLIWAGTSYPTFLAVIDPVTLKRKKLPEFISTLGFVFVIKRTNDSTLWIGTYGNGLWRFILDKKGDIKKFKNFTPDSKSKTTISSFIIRSIFLDSQNNLWIGTDKGLNRIDSSELNKSNPQFISYTNDFDQPAIRNKYILQIMESRDGIIWIGTMGGGLIKCEKNNISNGYTFSAITTKEGLPSNTIKSVVEDEKGYLWLASNNGLTRFNPLNGEMINYNRNHGLQANEFSEIAAIKRKNGQIIFGGVNGINVFFPEQINIDKVKPKMYLTEFFIGNQKILPGDSVNGRILLKESIEFTKQIRLKYKENSFSIGFVGLQYNVPEINNYKYILEGFDHQWNNSHSNYPIAKYTNIPEGEYIFKVVGSNSDNIWSDAPATLKIIINPPFYRSKLAIALYFLILFIIVFLFFKISNIISNKKRELLIANFEKKKIEDISQLKQQFFTNISHEFRTPLTLITNPIDRLINEQNKLSGQQKNKYYKLIKKNANILLRLTDQLMDFTKIEQNKLKVNIKTCNIIPFLKEIYENFTPLATQKNISYSFRCTTECLMVNFDKEKLEKIMYNLLSNAFKFTLADGTIEVLVNKDEQEKNVIISVKDSGIGIDKDKVPYVFDRFFQVNPEQNRNTAGTGIGLAFSKALAEVQNGKISLESSLGKGAEFKVFLPLANLKNTEGLKKSHNLGSSTFQNKTDQTLEKEQTLTNINIDISNSESKYKVLFVEDNQDLLGHIEEVYKNFFQIYKAENGIQAIEICKKKNPDIVVSDIMMPQMDGIEFCKSLKTEEAISHIPVILLTAKNSEEEQIEGYGIGGDAYVTKPFNTEILKAQIISIIKNRELIKKKFQDDLKINPSVVSNTPADSKFLKKIIALIEKNLSNPEYNVEKLAEEYGVSRIYLNRKIKSLTGETSNQFLRNIRLKHAAELLKQNSLTVSEVTWMVGYNDLKTFRTRFKEKFGISPSEYAKQYKNE